jgi:hypothetical protein
VRVLVHVGPPATARVGRAHVLLHTQPGPPPEPSLARHTACLESTSLDAAALERVKRILDELL